MYETNYGRTIQQPRGCGMDVYGRAGRIAWLIVMLVFYTFAGIPYLALNCILTLYSQLVTLFLFATNPIDMDLSDKEEPS